MINREPLYAKIIKWILRGALCLFALIPIYSAVIIGLTPYAKLLEPQLFPHYFAVENFMNGFDFIIGNIANSFLYAICATLLTTAVSVPAAYAIAHYRFKFKRVVLFGLLLTQMMAGIVILPSIYNILNNLRLINSRIGIILIYATINLALVVWIHYGYFLTLPGELEESAEVDGCNYLETLVKIIIPISGPGIAVGAIFVFINTYNEFVVPLFLLNDRNRYPLTLSLYSLLTDATIRWHIIAASSLIAIIPPVVLFVFFQRYIIQGVTAGAVKG